MKAWRLFVVGGIPVSLDPLFLIGAFTVFEWTGGGRRGALTVAALLLFTVIHEFGHATTARRFGSRSAITITFLGGFASYVPLDRFTTRHRVAVTLAGPLIHLAAGAAAVAGALVALHTSPADGWAWDLFRAVAWAGVTGALLNLLPAWPLDGGHTAADLLRRRRARSLRPLLTWSLVVAAVMAVMYVVRKSSPTADVFATLDGPAFRTTDISWAEAMWHEIRALPGVLLGGTLFIPGFIAIGSISELAAAGATLDARRSSAPTERTPAPDSAALARAALTDLSKLSVIGWTDAPEGDEPAEANEVERWLAQVPADLATVPGVLRARVHHGPVEALLDAADTRHLAVRRELVTSPEVELDIKRRAAEPLYTAALGLAARGRDTDALKWLRRAISWHQDVELLGHAPEFEDLRRGNGLDRLLAGIERGRRAGRT